MSVGIIVQARTGSTRLPRKVLAEVNGQPLLAHLIGRLHRARLADIIVVGTTQDPSDDPVAEIGADLANLYRWPAGQSNVLAGFIAAAQSFGVDTVVRVTADCPLLDPATVDMLIARFRMGDCEHVEVGGLPDGAWCEVVSLDTLERIASAPDLTDQEREHVTLYARRRPDQFRLARPDMTLGMDRERWSVDTAPDLAFVTRVIEALPRGFTFGDVQRLVAAHPEWREINAGPLGPIDTELLDQFRHRSTGRVEPHQRLVAS